jgi:hypothetical protein
MRPSRFVPAAVLATALAGLAVPPAMAATSSAQAAPAAAPRPLHPRRTKYRPTGRLEVKFKDGVSATRQRAVLAGTQGVRVDRLVRSLNVAVVSAHNLRAVQALLRADSAVEFVEPESRYEAFTAEPVSNELHEIGADAVHDANPTTPNLGQGAEIAIIDSQVDAANADLDDPGKVTFAGDFTTAVPDDPNDPSNTHDEGACVPATCPHGTAVAGVAAGDAGDGGMAGVAPSAKIRSYNVFRRFTYDNPFFGDPGEPARLETLSASSVDIAAALQSIATNIATTPNLVAVNMSLGGTFDNQLIRDKIAALHAAAPNLVVVVAAGNDGSERADFPAGDPYVLSVGAIGQIPVFDGNGDYVDCASASPAQADPWSVSEFSNRGDVDVVAPGRCVTAWYPPENSSGAVSGPAVLTKVDGTSFAAPMVAGAAALLGGSVAGVRGDAARAALIAGATHTGQNVNVGTGPAKADSSIALATGTTPYSAVSVDRGGQVATSVGKRTVEAIRVEPGNTTTPTDAPGLAATSGFGSFGTPTDSVGNGLTTRRATFSATPGANLSGQTFALTATAPNPATDVATVPMKMLDAGDNYEGQPAATNEGTSVALTYGARTAYVRSAAVNTGTLSWAWTFDDHGYNGLANLFIWEPTDLTHPADAAMEPLAAEWNPDFATGTDHVTPGSDNCDLSGATIRLCHSGRWLIGWMTFGSMDNSASGSTYKLKLTYTGPTATLTTPVLASTTSTTGPFTVSWSGTHAHDYDVSYALKTKVGSVWTQGPWVAWKTATTATSAVFGSGGLPVAVTQGQTYRFLVRSHDALANPSLTVTKATTAPFDDRNAAMTYSSGWISVAAAGRWLGTVRQSGTVNAKVSLKSETDRFTVVGDKCAACGQFKVYIDGVGKGTFDSHASSTLTRQALWTSTVFSGGIKSHTISIVVVGTAGRPKVVIDGIANYR